MENLLNALPGLTVDELLKLEKAVSLMLDEKQGRSVSMLGSRYFVLFEKIGVSPVVKQVKLQVHWDKTSDKFWPKFEYFDNRFTGQDSTLGVKAFEAYTEKLLLHGYVQIPVEVYNLLRKRNLWSYYSLYSQYINNTDFDEAVKATAGFDGLPELG